MGKPCVAFQLESASDALKHLYSNSRITTKYGDHFAGNRLHKWEKGERVLFHCQVCGGYYLLQDSEFYDLDGSCCSDYFPVTGPEEAEDLNRRWDGWKIEKCFPEKYLFLDEHGSSHWMIQGREENSRYGQSWL